MHSKLLLLSLFSSSFGLCFGQQAAPSLSSQDSTHAKYLKLASEVDEALHGDVIDLWFPRAVDHQNGGFYANFSREWKPLPDPIKFSVFQSRMVWVASEVALRDPKRKQEFLPIVHHGVDFLQNKMWDKQDGGFFMAVDNSGNVNDYFGDSKHLYGISFCIYGAAAAYHATNDPKALALARDGFLWIDKHAHDATNGGYIEFLNRDGSPVASTAPNGQVTEALIGAIGYKSMNTHIHLLEALTELYRVWPDPLLRARLEEMLAIVRDKICVEPGVMNQFFTNAWQPVPDHDSYGHDVETAYLMLEADEVLHQHASPATERMAKMLVDHALAYGWDTANGGFFAEGPAFGPAENKLKEWWVEVEGLNALLLMHERYGKQDGIYFERFLDQWKFIRTRTIDAQYRGLYNLTQADGTPITEDKGEIWKAAYHDSRAFMNVSERLHRLAEKE